MTGKAQCIGCLDKELQGEHSSTMGISNEAANCWVYVYVYRSSVESCGKKEVLGLRIQAIDVMDSFIEPCKRKRSCRVPVQRASDPTETPLAQQICFQKLPCLPGLLTCCCNHLTNFKFSRSNWKSNCTTETPMPQQDPRETPMPQQVPFGKPFCLTALLLQQPVTIMSITTFQHPIETL